MNGARIESVEGRSDPTSQAPLEKGRAKGGVDVAGDLKRRTVRGALASVVGQGANFALRVGSMVVIARLVTPAHFGLVGMVTAFTGLLNLFRDGGLPQAAVQKEHLSDDLMSTLFWLNLAIGVALAALTAAAAPLLALFYGDARLVGITIAIGTSFVLNGASAQHRALLQRDMRFATLALIDIVALLASVVVGIWMALSGLGYWALVAMAVVVPGAAMVGVWVATGWMPGRPRRGTGASHMLRYGGLITANSLVVYAAYNMDKVLLGRFWGAEVLGLYGRAYQLINIPTENLQSAMGWVMFPALARVQGDAARLRNYFLKGYGLFLAVVMPISVACAAFAPDIVRVLLGSQWNAAVPVFRFLAPTILAFALLNPTAYLLQATGRALRSVKIAFFIAPLVIAGYILGLPSGPTGVALGFSAAMLVVVGPVAYWAKKGTLITGWDILRVAVSPLISTLLGAAAALATGLLLGGTNALARLVVQSLILFGVHGLMLLFVLGQWELYADVLRTLGIFGRRGVPGQAAADR